MRNRSRYFTVAIVGHGADHWYNAHFYSSVRGVRVEELARQNEILISLAACIMPSVSARHPDPCRRMSVCT